MIDLPRVFLGYDPDEALAWSVCAFSIQRRSSLPVMIAPVMLSQVRAIFARPRHPLQSNEFAFSRFLVPFLCGYRGWALFMDSDMLARADLAELWALRDERYAVQVVKHQQHDPNDTKYLGRPQRNYARKNWSSLMLMNCCRCRALTPDVVGTADGLWLHQFGWLPEDGRDIGELPAAWNHLVGHDAPNAGAKMVHYTLGMPFFHGYAECEYAAEWRAERSAMMAHAAMGVA